MKRWLILLLLSSQVIADSNSMSFSIPSISSVSGSDSIRAGDLDCKNAIGGATQLEFGVTGIIDNARSPFSSNDPLNPQSKDVGIYARIVIPLDKPKERVNCNTLYQLELRKKRIEVLKLQQELEALRKMNAAGANFEN